jgi:NADPH:quinone reductase-like Zn-dependent oxidoreductase
VRAIVRNRFGPPDVLEHTDASARPIVAAGEVLVRVHAAGVNQGDALEQRGWPYVGRLMGYGLRRPKHPIPGTDVAGRVVAVGADVDDLLVGDAVLGWGRGAFAEYSTAPRSALVRKPDGMTFEHAAALPTAGVAALQAVRDAGQVRSGQRVLILGASGGVGTFAVQLAKSHGGHVTATSSSRNLELLRELGADRALDYAVDDVTSGDASYDVIIDLVGHGTLRSFRRVLSDTGTFVVVGGRSPRSVTGMRRFAAAAAMSPFVSQRFVPLFSKPDPGDLDIVVSLAADGRVRPDVDRAFLLVDAAAALRHLETGHARGKVVITV